MGALRTPPSLSHQGIPNPQTTASGGQNPGQRGKRAQGSSCDPSQHGSFTLISAPSQTGFCTGQRIANNKVIYARQRPSRFMPYIRSKAQTHSPPHVAGSFVRGIWIFDPRSQDESLKEHQRQTCAVTPTRLWSRGYILRHIYGPPKQDKSITTYSSSYKSDINLIPLLPVCPNKH